MNFEELMSKIEEILDENDEQENRWLELYVKSYNAGNNCFANTCLKEAKYCKVRNDAIFKVVELIEKMSDNK